MEVLFDGIDLGDVTTSMTINSTAADRSSRCTSRWPRSRESGHRRLGGTLQNDILKEYIAQKEYIFPPRPSMRLITDKFSFCAKHVPKWNTISISGYHIREAGSTALQELAFTLRDGIEYVEYGVDAGLDVDEFAPRLSFFFNSHNDFFEEIAKFRAARRVWAKMMRERFGAKRPALLDVPVPHPDGRLLADRPAAVQQRRAHAAPGARGGSRRDEVAPHQLARRDAGAADRVRGDARAADAAGHRPRVGRREHDRSARRLLLRRGADRRRWSGGCFDYFRRIDALGGMVEAIEAGFPQREIMDAAYAYQRAVDAKEKIVVGVNDFVMETRRPIEILYIDESVGGGAEEARAALRRRGTARRVSSALEALGRRCADGRNVMPPLIEAVRPTRRSARSPTSCARSSRRTRSRRSSSRSCAVDWRPWAS